MRGMTILLIAVGILLIVGAYIVGSHMTREPKHAVVQIRGQEFRVEIENTMLGRAQGLSGRDGLGENEGMLFDFVTPGDYEFWMNDMRFPIDIIWIEQGKIVGFAERVQPEPEKNVLTLTVYHPPQPVRYVLEVPAGTVAKYGFEVGDAVSL